MKDDLARKMLKEIAYDLLKYCHSKTCRFPTQCPRDHQKCRQSLGLHTAIAWRVAQHIARLLNMEKISLDIIQDHLTRISEFINVLAYHTDKFQQLYGLLNEAVYWIGCLEFDKDDC
ncbi:MAG: hypothetical protein DRO05_00915 [Thermoproteota archaeon]|nr:MAG: hypothetical protein DRO05_00915 [Candidatus Korarchaeota archaeon]